MLPETETEKEAEMSFTLERVRFLHLTALSVMYINQPNCCVFLQRNVR